MPTSGVTDWTITAGEVCRQAALELRAIESGEELTADEQDDMIFRLNGMLKSWGVNGNLFREATGTITVPADSASGTLPPGIRDISAVRLVVSADNERPLAVWNRAQYFRLPNRTASGSPTACYFEKGVSVPTLYVWPVPTEDTTLKVDYSRSAEIVTDGDETLDIPQDWQETVIKNLAVRCAQMFGEIDMNAPSFGVLKEDAERLYTRFMDADRPDSYVFEPYDGYY